MATKHSQPGSQSRTFGFVQVRSRGEMTLPAAVRRGARLNDAGSQVEVVVHDDGVIELHPYLAHPVDQAWFWTPEWQAREAEVDAEVERGDLTIVDEAGLAAFLDDPGE